MSISRFLIMALCSSATAAPAVAGDVSPWSFHGYGTVGVVHSDEAGADYQPDLRLPSGPGRSGDWDMAVDSRLAVQVAYRPSERVSAVVQVIAEESIDGSFQPAFEWANVELAVSRDLRLRVGRIAPDMFITSDYRKVGFALPWVRPPAELYRLMPVTYSDGVDATYLISHGELSYRAQVAWGRTETSVSEGEGLGLYQNLDWRDLTLHLSYVDATLTIPAAGELFDLFAGFGPEGRAVEARYGLDDAPFEFYGVGLSFEPGSLFLMAEWGALRSETMFGNLDSWYVSGGRRFGALTPYTTFARAERDRVGELEGLTPAAYPPPTDAMAAALNGVLDQLLDAAADQKTLSLGLRWDVLPSAALKVQYDLIDVTDGSPGAFIDLEPGFQPGRVDVFSVSLDFIF